MAEQTAKMSPAQIILQAYIESANDYVRLYDLERFWASAVFSAAVLFNFYLFVDVVEHIRSTGNPRLLSEIVPRQFILPLCMGILAFVYFWLARPQALAAASRRSQELHPRKRTIERRLAWAYWYVSLLAPVAFAFATPY